MFCTFTLTGAQRQTDVFIMFPWRWIGFFFFCFLFLILPIPSLVQNRWAVVEVTFVLVIPVYYNLQSKVRETRGRRLALCTCAI